METIRFAVIVGADGEVVVSSESEARIARRLAGLIELEPGGLIVMSTDVNAKSEPGLKGWAKSFVKTWYNRAMKNRKVDEEMKKLIEERGMDTGWSIGNLFKGRYYSRKSDTTFNEKSFAIEIRGVPFSFVKKAGEALRKKFSQEAVLLVDYDGNKTYILE